MNIESAPTPIRVFAAIRPSEATLNPLSEWWDTAHVLLPKTDWRPIPIENWHVTLAFYGELDPKDLPGLQRQLDEIAGETPCFGIETRGFGAFPSAVRPRVFWVGTFAIDPPKALAELAYRCLYATDEKVRVNPKKSPQTFRGHISLARSKGRRTVDLAPFGRQPPPMIREQVGAICLYRSELTPKGARYRLIERFPLKN